MPVEYPWFRFWAKEYLTDIAVATMPLVAQGAYLRLLCYQWKAGGLPDNTGELALLCPFSRDEVTAFSFVHHPQARPPDVPQWELFENFCWTDRLEQKFPVCKDGLRRNAKLEEERAHCTKLSTAGKAGGVASAQTRRKKRVRTAVPRSANDSPTAGQASQSQSQMKKKRRDVPNKVRHEFSDPFLQFWDAYPQRKGRKRGKDATFAAWRKLPWEFQQETIPAARNYAESEDARDGFARDPVRFIKDNWWRDWVEPAEGYTSEPEEDPASDGLTDDERREYVRRYPNSTISRRVVLATDPPVRPGDAGTGGGVRGRPGASGPPEPRAGAGADEAPRTEGETAKAES